MSGVEIEVEHLAAPDPTAITDSPLRPPTWRNCIVCHKPIRQESDTWVHVDTSASAAPTP